MAYRLVTSKFSDGTSNQTSVIRRLSDDVFIPMNENNCDYQQYLEWVAEGNTPEPAE
tara:strand:+ start:275 stop:445 length:171 start_codon:yes stop_codon:yes gene_type:complete